jgi:hypothetical protein
VRGEYSNIDAGGGSSGDLWLGGLGATVDFGSGFGAQGDVEFGTLDVTGLDKDLWGVGAGVFLRDLGSSSSRLGAGVQYYDASNGASLDVTYYGLAGEGYLSDMFTLAARGGAFSRSPGSDGYYLGGEGSVYPFPNLALNLNLDYVDFDSGGDITDFGAEIEALPFNTIPISVYGGYDRADFSGGGDWDVWTIGLKAYLGAAGDGTLVSHHRQEVLRFAPKFRF